MFPLFRKDKEATSPAGTSKGRNAPGSRADAEGPASISSNGGGELAAGGMDVGGIQVHESDVRLAPEVEEAVMLYANGRVGEACSALNRFILNHPENRDPLPWRLLFDGYEATGQRQPFEDMALDYAVRFESSPPTWQAIDKPREEANVSEEPEFAFGAMFTPQDRARLQHFFEECANSDTVTVDFSKAPVPNAEAQARPMLECLTRLVAMGKAVRLIGGEAFLVRLNASRSNKRLIEPAWQLLLLILQLLGKVEAFEDAAIEFAVSFEISPPSYVPPRRRAENAEPETGEGPRPNGQAFAFQGVLNSGSAAEFDALLQFAADQPRVDIDFSQVTRVDFAVVGLLMDSLIALAKDRKLVVILDPNDMVSLFLNMVGAGQYAMIQTRKRA